MSPGDTSNDPVTWMLGISLEQGLKALGSAGPWALGSVLGHGKVMGGTLEAGQGHKGLLVASGPRELILIPPHFHLIEWTLVFCSET